jgi:hypothetical protein
MLARLVCAVVLLVASAVASPAGADRPAVAAASDLKFALEEIEARFSASGGKRVKLAFGSSGNFARQIRQGAPFEMFLSADEAFVEGLARDGLTRDEDGGDLDLRPRAGVRRPRLDYELDAPRAEAFAAGSEVSWGILPAHCILHRRDRPSRGEHENPVAGVIGEFVPFGENAAVTLHVGGREDAALHFSVPTHVAARNGLQAGVQARVSLLREGIHLMPRESH